VAYVCANEFDLQNPGPTALTVQFEVAGTSERGELLLPPRSAANTPSTTRLITLSAVLSMGSSLAFCLFKGKT
jgi:hypothetical protein